MKRLILLAAAAALLCGTVSCGEIDDSSQSSAAEKITSTAETASADETASAENTTAAEEGTDTPRLTTAPAGELPSDGVDTDFGTSDPIELQVGAVAKRFVRSMVEGDVDEMCQMMFPTELAKAVAASGDAEEMLDGDPETLTSFKVKSYKKVGDKAIEGAKLYYTAIRDTYGTSLDINVNGGYELEAAVSVKEEEEPVEITLMVFRLGLSEWKIIAMDEEEVADLTEY